MFLLKAWVNPFQKVRFFGHRKITFSYGKKRVPFFIANSESIISSLILGFFFLFKVIKHYFKSYFDQI